MCFTSDDVQMLSFESRNITHNPMNFKKCGTMYAGHYAEYEYEAKHMGEKYDEGSWNRDESKNIKMAIGK